MKIYFVSFGCGYAGEDPGVYRILVIVKVRLGESEESHETVH